MAKKSYSSLSIILAVIVIAGFVYFALVDINVNQQTVKKNISIETALKDAAERAQKEKDQELKRLEEKAQDVATDDEKEDQKTER